MYELLNKAKPKHLYDAIDINTIKQYEFITGDKLDRADLKKEILIKIILSVYGYELLYEQPIRNLIYRQIDSDTLRSLANKYLNKSYNKSYDNALALSLKPWSYNSSLVKEIALVLRLDKKYIPQLINRNQSMEIVDPISEYYELYEYQRKVKEYVINAINKEQRILVQMPTGSGKTRTIIEAMMMILGDHEELPEDYNVIWIAHTEELCEQAIDTFKDIWQAKANREARIIRLWGAYKVSEYDVYGAFIFGTFQKLYSMKKSSDRVYNSVKDNIILVIVDEAHKAIAPTYKELINDLLHSDSVKLIGLSATPGRGTSNTKDNIELAKYFHKNLVEIEREYTDGIETIEYLQSIGVLSNIKRRVVNTGISVELKNSSQDIPNILIKKLAENQVRNKMIVDVITGELEKEHPCLVFTCGVNHSKLLSSIINYKGYKASYIDYNLRKGIRKNVISKFKDGSIDALFNYGVLTTGFDAPRIKTILITRPTSSIVLYSQMVGRGLRGPLMGGAQTCNLIDIKDNYENYGDIDKVYSYFNNYWK